MQKQDTSLPLIKVEQDKKLSKLQADFNAKIKRISELKQNIEDLKLQVVEINTRIEEEVVPVEKELAKERASLVKAMANAYHSSKLSKKERETLEELIMGEAWDLIENFGEEELKVIYDQFSHITFDEEQKQMQEESRKHAFSMFENMTGMKFDDFQSEEEGEMNDFERMHRMKEAYEEKMKQEQWEAEQRRAKRKKSAKQEAREQKLKEEAELLTKSSRAIYMELAKELHPDREPDEQKRAIKTELMQRITAAYNNNDLYELLRLRLEYKQSEMDSNAVPEKQLELYVKILKEQVSALQAEYNSFFGFFNPQTERLQRFGLGKKKNIITRSINQEKKKIRNTIEQVKYTRDVTMKNNSELKAYLKEQGESSNYNNDFDNLLGALLGGFR